LPLFITHFWLARIASTSHIILQQNRSKTLTLELINQFFKKNKNRVWFCFYVKSRSK
jgi:hypothetical protein